MGESVRDVPALDVAVAVGLVAEERTRREPAVGFLQRLPRLCDGAGAGAGVRRGAHGHTGWWAVRACARARSRRVGRLPSATQEREALPPGARRARSALRKRSRSFGAYEVRIM